MEFTNAEIQAMSAKYKHGFTYYRDFIAMQTRNVELVQTLHRRANLLTLTAEQRAVYSKITKIIDEGKPRIIFLEAAAGSGKSHLAAAVAGYCHQKGKKYIASSFLGVAAASLNSASLFSLLGLWCAKCPATQIPGFAISSDTRRRFHNTKLLILDEISLVGSRMFYAVSYRMQLIMENAAPFGSCILLALGDFSQLLPVGDVCLQRYPEQLGVKDLYGREGCRLYHSAVKISLSGNFRSKEDLPFARLLNNIRNKSCTPEDIKLLSTRFEHALTDPERAVFANSTNIFSTNRQSHLFNQSWALSQNKPLIYIEPSLVPHCNQCLDDYRGVYLGKDMEIVLNKNVNVRLQMCNGSRFYTHDFVYRNPKSAGSMPDFITLEDRMGKYNGMTLVYGKKIVPLFPVLSTIQCFHDGSERKVLVKYFPLSLANSITVHKSQSRTIDRVTCHLNEFNGNYDRKLYVCLSRVRKLSDLMLVGDDKLEFFLPVVSN